MKRIFLTKWEADTKVELTLLFVTDLAIRRLNRAYRQKDKPTDVLSFPTDEKGFFRKIPLKPLGDIVISVETAERQAKDKKHSFEKELKFLLIHGFLHLLGYDHEISREEEIRMQRKEREYMKIVEKL